MRETPATLDLADSQSDKLMRIGEVAESSGLPVKTIRYYEEIGLLGPTVARSEVGYRLFSGQVLQRLAFIKQLQAFGLHLNEVHHILEVHDRGELPCAEIQQRLEEKVALVTEQIQALETLRSELQSTLAGWRIPAAAERDGAAICPNLSIEGLL